MAGIVCLIVRAYSRAEGFSDRDFNKVIAKNVRANHVQTNAVHWANQQITPNRLKI